MPRHDLIPPEQRLEEGRILREIFLAYQKDNSGISQDRFCADHEINQGQLQRWFSGARQIPEHRLIQLSKAMGFDPRRVRPSLQETMDDLADVTATASLELATRWQRLSPAQVQEALRFLDLLERAGDPSSR